MIQHLTPAYGRDYKSKKALLEDWHADKDFLLCVPFGQAGPDLPVNRSQALAEGWITVNIRYKRLQNVAVVKVADVAKPSKVKAKVTKQPSEKTMMRWVMDGVAKATDGCTVEPDGHCEHGKPSWLLELDLV